ncbi:MAG: hypothetical protein GIKADHBN_02066 [Phycisphaerales bacterium]|nr:hypothetical protein [Phycisphaerales bacterium]
MTSIERTPGRVARRRGRALVVVVGLASVGGLGGAVSLWGGRETVSPDRATDIAVVKRAGFAITTACSGRLEARRQVEIRSKLDTRSNIIELVEEGKFVKAGDMLMRLNTDEIQTAVREEQLAVETARSEAVAAENACEIQANENQSKLRQAESKLRLAELSLKQWKEGEVKKKSQELDLAIEKTARDLARMKEKVQTSQALNKQGFLSKDELQRDEIAFTEATLAAQAAVLDKEIYWQFKHPEELETKSSALDEARSELERVTMNNKIELASKESARTTRRKQLEIHEARLKELQKQVDEASIRAPVDGLVVYAFSMGLGWRETPLQVGQPVYRNELVMILPDTSEMLASVSIHESLSGKVAPGQAVDVRVEAAGNRSFRGTVESLGVLAETGDMRDSETREYKVKISLDPASLKGAVLKPSMRVDATITLGTVENALTIPVQSIFSDGALRYVYERRGGRVVRTPVSIGQMSHTQAEVTGGLQEGALVLTRDVRPDEITPEPWDRAALAAVGFTLGEDGRPVAITPPNPPEGTAGGSAVAATDPATPDAAPASP